MFNALWFNAQELNGTGQLYRGITLGGTVACGAAVNTRPSMYVRYGLRSTVSAGATALVSLIGAKGLAGSASTNVIALNTNYMAPKRTLGGYNTTNVHGFLGVALAKTLAASASVHVSAIMTPYVSLASMVSTNVRAAAGTPVLTRTQMFASARPAGATVSLKPTMPITRNFFVKAKAGANATATWDIKVGGTTRWALFGAYANVLTTSTATADPHRWLAGQATTTSVAVNLKINMVYRVAGVPATAGASVTQIPFVGALRYLYAPQRTVGASAQGMVTRTALLSGSGLTQVSPRFLPQMKTFYFLAGRPNPIVTAVMAPMRILSGMIGKGMSLTNGLATLNTAPKLYAFAYSQVSAQAPAIKLATPLLSAITPAIALPTASANVSMLVKPSILLGAAASVRVSENSSGYFTSRILGGQVQLGAISIASLYRRTLLFARATVSTTASSTVYINLLSPEPDFRTFVVDPDVMTYTIDPDVLASFVTDDSLTMQTFTKQVGDSLAYDIDFTQWFAQTDGDYITGAVTTVLTASSGIPTALTAAPTVLANDVTGVARIAKVYISGGVSGATYELRTTITTQFGLVKEANYLMTVKDI